MENYNALDFPERGRSRSWQKTFPALPTAHLHDLAAYPFCSEMTTAIGRMFNWHEMFALVVFDTASSNSHQHTRFAH